MPLSPISGSEQKNRRSRGRPPLSEPDLLARREKITEIATRMFVAQGFAATTLEAIGAAAGVTKRTIYELIGDKQALFRAACNRMRAGEAGFQFDISLTNRSASEILQQLAHQLIDHSLEKELITLARAVIAEAVQNEDLVRETVNESSENLFRVLSQFFDTLIDAGLLKPIDSLAAAKIFYDATVGTRSLRAVLGLPPETAIDGDIEARVEMFLHGYVERTATRHANPIANT